MTLTAKAPTSAFVVGPHSRIDRNGILFNDLMDPSGVRQIETLRVINFTGFGKAEIVASSEQRSQQHGAIPQPSWYGTRTTTLTGQIVAGSYTAVLNMTAALEASLVDLRELPTIISTIDAPDSYFTQPDWQFLSRVADYDIARDIQQSDREGIFYRNFTVALFSSDPRYYSIDLHTATLVPTVLSSLAFTFDLTFDLLFDETIDPSGIPTPAGNTVNVLNAGNFDAPLILRFIGPMSGVTLTNTLNGQMVRLIGDVSAGDYVEIDTDTGTVRNSTGTSVAYVRDTASDWMVLASGVNPLALGVSSFSAGASLQATWRDTSITA